MGGAPIKMLATIWLARWTILLQPAIESRANKTEKHSVDKARRAYNDGAWNHGIEKAWRCEPIDNDSEDNTPRGRGRHSGHIPTFNICFSTCFEPDAFF